MDVMFPARGGHLVTIWIHHRTQKRGKGCVVHGVVQHQTGYHADTCLGYDLMLFWDNMDTFW